MVDIILLCYKQELYIEQALRSIYAQELSKDISARIIVADDASLDNTLAIIKGLAPESPFPMIFLPKEPNMGISKNYKRSFAATEAEYVAILEGDDYWLPNHLIQHIEFLQAHPECSMSMGEITYLHEPSGVIDVEKLRLGDKQDCILVDVRKQIIEGNQLGNLSACMFRGQYLRELPGGLYEMPIADWMLGVMLAQRGFLALIKGSTSVYRVKESGVWAGRSKLRKQLTLINDARRYNAFQKGKFNAEWKCFENRRWCELRRNWIHYLPQWIQNIHAELKR